MRMNKPGKMHPLHKPRLYDVIQFLRIGGVLILRCCPGRIKVECHHSSGRICSQNAPHFRMLQSIFNLLVNIREYAVGISGAL